MESYLLQFTILCLGRKTSFYLLPFPINGKEKIVYKVDQRFRLQLVPCKTQNFILTHIRDCAAKMRVYLLRLVILISLKFISCSTTFQDSIWHLSYYDAVKTITVIVTFNLFLQGYIVGVYIAVACSAISIALLLPSVIIFLIFR